MARVSMFLFLQRRSFWGTVSILDGDQKMEGNGRVKTWTALLAEIFHPGSSQVFLGQPDLRQIVGGRKGGREHERDVKDNFIQATSQGKPSALSRCLWFIWICEFWHETELLCHIIHSLLVRLLKLTYLPWNIGIRDAVWHLFFSSVMVCRSV